MKLELELAEVNMIMAGLGKLPYEAVEPLVMKIREQAIPQLPKAEEAEE